MGNLLLLSPYQNHLDILSRGMDRSDSDEYMKEKIIQIAFDSNEDSSRFAYVTNKGRILWEICRDDRPDKFLDITPDLSKFKEE